MSDQQLQEDDILEQLNQKPDIHGLLSCAIEIIATSIDYLMMRVFRKERHAQKFVIPSLIRHDGPLSELSVRLKLLYALSIITHQEYEDIELLLALLDELNQDPQTQYQFSDDEILGPIMLLHDMIMPPNLQFNVNQEFGGIVDSMKSSLFKQRQQQVIRSSLIIAITNLAVRLNQRELTAVSSEDDN